MLWTGCKHLPVIDHGALVGVLSERDILRYRASIRDSDPMLHPVRAAMTSPAITIDPEETIERAAEMMAELGVGCLPVVRSGDVIGMVTTTDLLRAHLAPIVEKDRYNATWTAGDVMTKAPLFTMRDELLVDAIAKMSCERVRHLPVLDVDHKVVGMLSDRDIRLQAENLDEPSPRLRDERMRVRAAMSQDVMCVRPETPASVLLSTFIDRRIGAVPVVGDDRRLVGIVSYVDVLDRMSEDATIER
jgi:CBS domain-containing protein